LSEDYYDNLYDQGLTQRRVKVSIQLPNKKKIELANIDMDRIKTKLHTVNDIQVYSSLKLDPITNSKVLTIASPVIFSNHTDQSIILQISDKKDST
jgi:hypothetical protein